MKQKRTNKKIIIEKIKEKFIDSEEFEKYLESIDGLENGYFTDREPIKSRHFFEVGEGWLLLIKNLIKELIESGWDKKICQVKEKFAGLRFYTNGLTDEQREIVRTYEGLSYETCERCGNKGSVRGSSWLVTLCDTCNKQEKS